MTTTRTIRIFLSSPSDVDDERDAAIRIIGYLKDQVARVKLKRFYPVVKGRPD